MNAIDELAFAARDLPEVIRGSVRDALASGEYRIGAGTWQSELAVCPIAAGALWAGVWEDGAIRDGAGDWGTRDGPSTEVEEFAAWFDICAQDAGLHVAVEVMRMALARSAARTPARCRT